jgi:hypothetical protein
VSGLAYKSTAATANVPYIPTYQIISQSSRLRFCPGGGGYYSSSSLVYSELLEVKSSTFSPNRCPEGSLNCGVSWLANRLADTKPELVDASEVLRSEFAAALAARRDSITLQKRSHNRYGWLVTVTPLYQFFCAKA